MTVTWAPKSEDEVVFRSISWIGQLAGATLVTSSLTILDDSSTITLTNVAFTDDEVTATVSAGDNGDLAVVQNEVTTSDGRTLIQIATMALIAPESVPTPTSPSTATKQTLCELALEEMGLDPYEFNATPQEYATLLRRLDLLAIELQGPGNNIPLNYNAPAVIGQSQLTDVSGIADVALSAVGQLLALRGAPAIGKTLSPESKVSFAGSMQALRTAYAVIPERILTRNTPRGAGNKPWTVWNPFGRQGN